MSLVELVNTLQGTDSHFAFSTGNTLPLVTRPHGMTAWIPQTNEGRWPHDLRSPKIQGFRSTRQPSPWIADYGQFLLAPTTGDKLPRSILDTESFHRRETSVAHPHYYRARLDRWGIVAEMTATERCAHFQFTIEEGDNLWLYIKVAQGTVLRHDPKTNQILGISTANQGGVTANFGSYFVIQPDAPVLAVTKLKANVDSPDAPDNGKQVAAALALKLKRPANKKLTVAAATSLISHAQARLNLKREIGAKTFAQTLAATKAIWNRRLACIQIEATEEQKRIFYSCLYRTFIFPRPIHEYDAGNKQIHYSPFTGKIHPGPLYTDSGFWDIYRTLLPFLTLVDPQLLGDMIQGWINVYKEGGWLPSWASPGYRPCMIGSHSNAVIADAYSKNIRNYDVETAIAAVLKDATIEPPAGQAAGRAGLKAYIKHGYVPSDHMEHAASATTDYAHCDYAAATLAAAIGKTDLAKQLSQRASNYKNLYNPKTGFIQGRLANGKFVENFNEFEWSRDYIEGGPWQHTWAAPHDAAGLIKLMGGDKKFVAKLDKMLSQKPRFTSGNYPCEIHEMTEMAAADFGQYAHSNQPVHHVLYLYTAAGRPDKAQAAVRRVMDELYTPEKFPGDEDNGEMSAWYILSALGLFPLTVGHPAWTLGTPRYKKITIQPANGKKLVIETNGAHPDKTPYSSAVRYNKKPHNSLEISHAKIAGGGTLSFTTTPNAKQSEKRGTLSRPFSQSTAA